MSRSKPYKDVFTGGPEKRPAAMHRPSREVTSLTPNALAHQSQQPLSLTLPRSLWEGISKRNDMDFKWVRLGFEGDSLRYMQLADKLGQTTRLQFTEIERNPVLDPSRFTPSAVN